MLAISDGKKLFIKLSLLALIIFGVEAIWAFRSIRSSQEQTFQKNKEQVVALVREKSAEIATPYIFTHGYINESRTVFKTIFNGLQPIDVAIMKAWTPEKTVIWSNMSEIIGARFPDNEVIAKAYAGQVVFSMGQARPTNLSEDQYVALTDFYIPLLDESGTIFGVVEVFIPVKFLEESDKTVLSPALIAIFGMTTSLYAIFAMLMLMRLRR